MSMLACGWLLEVDGEQLENVGPIFQVLACVLKKSLKLITVCSSLEKTTRCINSRHVSGT